jgi:hypothetical protein
MVEVVIAKVRETQVLLVVAAVVVAVEGVCSVVVDYSVAEVVGVQEPQGLPAVVVVVAAAAAVGLVAV